MATVHIAGVGLGIDHPRGNVGGKAQLAPTLAEMFQEPVDFGWGEAIEMSDEVTGLGVALYGRKHIEFLPAREEECGRGAEHGGEGADGVEGGVGVVAAPKFGQLADGTAALVARQRADFLGQRLVGRGLAVRSWASAQEEGELGGESQHWY
ncbi:hypothetical protein OG749_46770 (plasmid) [Streptomyces nojiriensis]|uniref:hypothetical protein n=1 Tax=Streptomyces nojiriensis TaxID=66374 RepID=UPI002E190EC8